jgi:predicted  nucleic acid-binding Zn-ribbon protein
MNVTLPKIPIIYKDDFVYCESCGQFHYKNQHIKHKGNAA